MSGSEETSGGGTVGIVGLSFSGLGRSRGSLAAQRRTGGGQCLRAEKPRVPVVEDNSRGPVRYSQRFRMAV